MSEDKTDQAAQQLSRRDFLKTSATVTAAAFATRLPLANYAFAAAAGPVRVGVIGCGGRGSGAAHQIAEAGDKAQLPIGFHALGDLFRDRLDGLRNSLKEKLADKLKVTDERCFTGFDAYQKVIDSGVDLVILATPPGFRPMQLKAAVDAGKHIFTEKPVATCPAGVRTVLAAAEAAKQKGLGIVAGTQRRHQQSYLECVQRLHDGAIGDIVAGQCYWNQGGLWANQRAEGQSEMEWQIRNWLYFTWLSGDHIVEQHVHNLDVMNWALGAHPAKCMGMGGRQARTDPVFGHIYDHFAIEYEYPNGARVMSTCRQIDGCANRVDELVIGTEGTAHPGGSIRSDPWSWRYPGGGTDPYVQELTDLLASIRDGKPLNEGQQVAESTLTAIMGRMSAYTGQEVSWEQALNSKLDLMRPKLEFGACPMDEIAVPGKTALT